MESAADYYLGVGDRQEGPFTLADLARRDITPQTLVWRPGMGQWLTAVQVPELATRFPAALLNVPPPLPTRTKSSAPALPGVHRKRLLAAWLAVTVGCFGIHKFVLRQYVMGTFMLVVSLASMLPYGNLTTQMNAALDNPDPTQAMSQLTSMLDNLPLSVWLITSILPLVGLFALVEGIIYFRTSDQKFQDKYLAKRPAKA